MSGVFFDNPHTGETVDVEGSRKASALLAGHGQTTEQHAQSLADSETERTTRDRINSIQNQLRLETASTSRGYGLRSLLGSLGSSRSSLLGSG